MSQRMNQIGIMGRAAINKVLKQIIGVSLLLYSHIAFADSYQAETDKRIKVKISKSGLNRISNPPYKITQVTGDDSKYRLKYDEDGTNIYFMPLSSIGENIEISIKNNSGFVQDLELSVSNIKGQSIIIDGKTSLVAERIEKSDIAQMLRAMKDNVGAKFYVQPVQKKFSDIGILKVEQSKIYKYKNIVGGIFEVSNKSKMPITLDVSFFAKQFDNVKSSHPGLTVIEANKTVNVLIVQKLLEK